MPSTPMLVYVAIGIAALLLAIVVARPAVTRSTEGKILAGVALFLAPAVAVYGGASEHLDRSKSTEYCLSCHVLTDYGKSMKVDDPLFLAAAHFQNNLVPRGRACYSCHSDYGWSGDARAKARGFKHVMQTYFGTVPDTIKISRRYRNRECLGCHVGSRSFEESVTHLGGPVPIADIRSGKVSCIKSGCHDLVHEVHDLDQMPFWDPLNPPVQNAPAGSASSAAGASSSGADSGAVMPGGRLP